jgi:glycosyltransferase involved in cell wall biosynthesis
VVYNDEAHIEKTIQSVLGQRYPHIEYLIIDGASSDATLEIIGRYSDRIKLSSEKDEGIYDAMNKGLRAASGDYVWFINSGDEIYSRETVGEMVKSMDDRPEVVYGGTMIIAEDGREIGDRRLKPPEHLTWKSLRQGMIVCHQSLVIRRDVAEEFDQQYRIAADFDWAIRSLRKADHLKHSGLVLSRFMEGGLSGTSHIRVGLKERFRIMTIHYGFLPTLLRHFLFAFRLGGFYLKHQRI